MIKADLITYRKNRGQFTQIAMRGDCPFYNYAGGCDRIGDDR